MFQVDRDVVETEMILMYNNTNNIFFTNNHIIYFYFVYNLKTKMKQVFGASSVRPNYSNIVFLWIKN